MLQGQEAQHLGSLSWGQVLRGAVSLQRGFSREVGVASISISICQGSANLRPQPGCEDSRLGLSGLGAQAPGTPGRRAKA